LQAQKYVKMKRGRKDQERKNASQPRSTAHRESNVRSSLPAPVERAYLEQKKKLMRGGKKRRKNNGKRRASGTGSDKDFTVEVALMLRRIKKIWTGEKTGRELT